LDRLLDREEDPIVTLDGMGGIGKTSTALAVLYELTKTTEYDFALWFSARDIDLLSSGPAEVEPRIRNIDDMATSCVQLLRPYVAGLDDIPPGEAFRAVMRGEMHSGRILFIFDNFETVHNPTEVFRYIKACVRLPNKALITTRHEDFRGHFPIQLPSMPYEMFKKLVDLTASRLGIVSLLSGQESWIRTVYVESYGHPYIVRMALGQVLRTKRLGSFDRMIASKREVLPALFKRSFDGLSEPAKRTMLLLCSWRSVVTVPALEAVLTRPGNEVIDVAETVKELEELSLVARLQTELDTVNVPQSAYQYVRRYELQDSPYRAAVAADAQYLRMIGSRGPNHGSAQVSLVSFVNSAVELRKQLDQGSVDHILRHLASRYEDGWLDVADYYQEIDDPRSVRECLQHARRLEKVASTATAERLRSVYGKLGDAREFDMFVELAHAYRSSKRYYDLSILTSQLADALKRGRGRDKRTQLREFSGAWNGAESRTSTEDALDLRTIAEQLDGPKSDEFHKWNQLAIVRSNSTR
jgi:hypothetical protein